MRSPREICPEDAPEEPLISQVTPERRWPRVRLGIASLCSLLCAASLLLWAYPRADRAARSASDPIEAMAAWQEILETYPRNSSQQLEEWERIPGMAKVIEHAKSLEPKIPLRGLQDLYTGYSNGYEGTDELPWVRTECVIDTVQATAYLVQAVVFLYRAIDETGLKCGDSDYGCAMTVTGFIASLTWVGSYLSLAASACAEELDGSDAKQLLGFETLSTTSRPYQKFFPAAQPPKAADTAYAIKLLHQANRERAFDITACVADSFNAAGFLVRVLLQVRASGKGCPDPRKCAIGILNVISSFSWISQMSLLAVSDCTEEGSKNALCGADISALVAASTMGPAAGMATVSDCADSPKPGDELDHEPTP
ncbi:unnamed protein product [Effrenium voratum]|nr:unnamed protein product [Effrenium voratum]